VGINILAYRDVFVVCNDQDPVIGRMSTPYPKARVIRTILVKCLSPLDVIIFRAINIRCGGVVVKALRYKPAGRGFDSRWYHWNFSVT
jgi:hypothetical protein